MRHRTSPSPQSGWSRAASTSGRSGSARPRSSSTTTSIRRSRTPRCSRRSRRGRAVGVTDRPAGLGPGSSDCDDGSPVANIDVDPARRSPARSPTAAGTRRGGGRRGPNDAQDFSFTAGGGLTPTSFSLDDDADGTLPNTRTLNDVPTGTVTRSRSPCRRVGPGERHVQRREPGRQHQRRPGRDGHLHVHQPQARSDRGRQGRAAQRRAGLRLHGGRRADAGELLARRRLRRRRSRTRDVQRRRPAGSGYSCPRPSRRLDPGLRDCSDGSPVSNISVVRRGDGHLHVRQQPARADRGRQGRAAQRPAGLRLHRGRPIADQLLSSTTTPTPTLLEHAHVRDLRPARATRVSETVPSGWDQLRDLRRRQPRVEHRRRPASRSPARSRTASAADRDREGRGPRRRRRTSLHGRRRPLTDELPARRRHRRDAVEHAHVRQRGARSGLLGLGDRPGRLGPVRAT